METYVPDGLAPVEAWARCTHLGIGAHQDDLEFWAFHGILQGLDRSDQYFGGVVCTDGAGSARSGEYAHYSDDDLREIRHREQEEAARIGQYGAIAQLAFPSAKIKEATGSAELAERLAEIFLAARAEVVYTHNPADKHETHIAVFAATIQALRLLPPSRRPKRVLGYEGWRDLDWMLDADKMALDVGGQEALATRINSVFASQIVGGKRYDLAVMGRRLANATFLNSHAVDGASMMTYAMDLTPLILDDSLDIIDFVTAYVDRFRADVVSKLQRQLNL